MSSTGRGPRLGGPDDFYATPAWCVHRLLEAWWPVSGMWVEPGAGNGAIIRAVNERTKGVSWYAIEKREAERENLVASNATPCIGDFLSDNTYAPGLRPSVVIGNPPYALAMEFIDRAMKIYPDASVAFLLRLNFAASDGRARFMRDSKPSVYVLPNRPSFTAGGKTDSIEYAWFVWDKNQLNQERFRVLGSTPAAERRKKSPDVGVASHGQSTLPNACDVDCAAAIPRSENDGKGSADPDRNAAQMAHQYNAERPSTSLAVPMKAGVVTSPGEQRALFGGDER